MALNEHSPLPWKWSGLIVDARGKSVLPGDGDLTNEPTEQEAFIVRAVNMHDALLNALRIAYTDLLGMGMPHGCPTAKRLRAVLEMTDEGLTEACKADLRVIDAAASDGFESSDVYTAHAERQAKREA